MGKEYRNIVRSRKLAERSYLYFSFPYKDTLEFYLPFMENITISESQRPNLVTYDLVGRAGNLFAYLGSKSREMQLKFYITLPNIVDYIHTVGLSELFSSNFRKIINEDSTEKREKFKKEYNPSQNKIENVFKYYKEAVKDIRQLDESFYLYEEPKNEDKPALTRFANSIKIDKNEPGFLNGLFGTPEQRKGFSDVTVGGAVDYLMKWINVIRCSVINNSTETQYGPPTIYLNHGTMYNNIPCVCTNYSVRIDDSTGYELLSMAPRRVEVTMTLSENRVGDFGGYTPFVPIEGDNLTGWEAVITGPGTLDPHNQFLRHYRSNNDALATLESLEAAVAAQEYNANFGEFGILNEPLAQQAFRDQQVDNIQSQINAQAGAFGLA